VATEALAFIGSPALEPELIAITDPATRCLRPRIDLGGVLVDKVDLGSALERVRGFVQAGRPHQIVTINLDFLSIAQNNLAFRELLNQADLAVADGMPLVWLSRLKGIPLPQRVAGVDLFAECCALAAEEGRRVFLLGAAPGVAEKAAIRLAELYPGLLVVGAYAPPRGAMTRKETERIVRMVRRAAPDFLFVALGAPRQDLWIREHMHRLNVPVAMGVGCVFDLFAGVVNRAPAWMQRCGLEWAFRLGQEPTRLWRRYLLNDLPVLGRLLLTKASEASTGGLVTSS
jgi:N-acetylglucosaminyldiphosphoundecaprenol N-acetyl-beta-D-mannosaminyltransferase